MRGGRPMPRFDPNRRRGQENLPDTFSDLATDLRQPATGAAPKVETRRYLFIDYVIQVYLGVVGLIVLFLHGDRESRQSNGTISDVPFSCPFLVFVSRSGQ